MRFYPTKIHLAFICFIFVSILLNLACSKDSDLLIDSVLDEEPISSIQDRTNEDSSQEDEIAGETEDTTSEETTESTLESRTTSFSPIHDAHVQSGRGYNENIIRLEENHRTSYLMFDLSPINTINGEITSAILQFTINGDDGSGTVNVHKGSSSDWTESSLSDNTAPSLDLELGSLIKEFLVGNTEAIQLNADNMTPDVSTLVLSHIGGNDLAFASKEHTEKIGPKLVITYEVEEGAEEITSTTEEDTNGEETVENKEPMAVADATPSSGGAPLEVTFKGSNSTDDTEVVGYAWNFDDETSSTEADPIHTFTQIGVYEVTLTVNDVAGLSTTDTVMITVTDGENQAPNAVISATPISGEAPLEVDFKGSDSTDDNSIASYAWDLKNGSKANAADFKYTFTDPGTYEVELVVADENGLTDKETITITVEEGTNTSPIAVASANPTSGKAPLAVQFVGDNSTDDNEVTSYAWNFKDGNSATTANPVHTFNTAGSYQVELVVKDNDGLSSTKTVTVIVEAVQNEAPKSVVTANPTSGTAPLEVQFLGQNSTDDKAVTSYSWNFKDGATATNTNPSHTFTQAGSYIVDLTVKDAQGLASTASITITVEASQNNGGGNAGPGYYVTTNGNSSNNGNSESSPWSIEHALNVVRAGDVVYVKAGNYGNRQLLTKTDGSSGNPIKFIGYRNTPGDVVSNQGSTFNYGEQISASKMPLFSGTPGQGSAITSYHRYVEFENFQITGYRRGVTNIERAIHNKFKNIIASKIGGQSGNSYDGFGFNIKGNNALIENCFVYNAAAEAINLADSDYSNINYTKVYSDNYSNPTDYYFLLSTGTNNTIIQNSYAERVGNLSHAGHGFDLKDLAENNTVKNCTAKNTTFELNFTGVRYNTFDGCSIYGSGTGSGSDTGLLILNGANNNVIKNMYIQDTYKAITWRDNNDGFVGPGGDRDAASMGYDNTFDRVTVKNTDRVLNVGSATSYSVKASRNTFTNCDFSNFESVAVTFYPTEDIVFSNCKFSNGNKLVIETQGQYAPYSHFDVSWQNCTWTNVNFSPPN